MAAKARSVPGASELSLFAASPSASCVSSTILDRLGRLTVAVAGESSGGFCQRSSSSVMKAGIANALDSGSSRTDPRPRTWGAPWASCNSHAAALGALLDARLQRPGDLLCRFTAAIIGARVIASTPQQASAPESDPAAPAASRAAARGLTGLALLIGQHCQPRRRAGGGARGCDANPDQLEKASPQS